MGAAPAANPGGRARRGALKARGASFALRGRPSERADRLSGFCGPWRCPSAAQRQTEEGETHTPVAPSYKLGFAKTALNSFILVTESLMSKFKFQSSPWTTPAPTGRLNINNKDSEKTKDKNLWCKIHAHRDSLLHSGVTDEGLGGIPGLARQWRETKVKYNRATSVGFALRGALKPRPRAFGHVRTQEDETKKRRLAGFP